MSQAEEWRPALVEGDPITKLSGKLSLEQLVPHAETHSKGGSDEVAIDASQITAGTLGLERIPDMPRTKISDLWNTPFWENIPDKPLTFPPQLHASTHEHGGNDPVRNLDYLAIRGTTVIDSERKLQNISKIIQDVLLSKAYPILTIEETEPNSYYPRLDLINPQRQWRIQNSLGGHLYIYDVTAGLLRHIVRYDTATDSAQFVWYHSGGSEIMRIDREGDLSLAGGLRIAGYDIISSARKLQNLVSIVQHLIPDSDVAYDLGSSTLRWRDLRLGRHAYIGGDIFQTKTNPALVLEETAPATSYPRVDFLNPQRRWRLLNDSAGGFRLIDATAGYSREIVYYATAADSVQKRWYNSGGVEIMRIDYEGDLTITGKLTQGACPQFSKMSLNEIKQFLIKCRDKTEPKRNDDGMFVCDVCGKPLSDDGGCKDPSHFNQFMENHLHKTQEEVMALIHLTLNLLERVEALENIINKYINPKA